MQNKNIHGTCPRSTPWGHADQLENIAPGIASVSTPSHGGYWLSAARRAEMHPCLAAHKNFAGPQWFEEDCDWVIPVLAFPELFSAFTVYHAVQAVKRDCGSRGYYKFDATEYFLQSKTGAQAAAMAELWFQENKERFMFGCQSGGAGGCRGQLDRVDGKEHFVYKCAEWPNVRQPFTLDEARAAGLEVLPVPEPQPAPVIAPEVKPGGFPAFDGINTVTSDADSGL